MPSPNKIDFNGQTLIDLTSDTVTPETLANGVTAHNASGVVITGAMTPGTGDLSQIIAENFDETKNYEIGDYVIYSNCLYRFSASHTAGAWDDTEVTPVTVTDTKVDRSGDVMTGSLTAPYFFAKDSIADSSADTIESNRYWGFGAKDKDDRWVNYIETSESTNGRVDTSFGARRVVNGGNVNNDLHLGVNADGTKTVSVSDPSLWRGAIGAFAESGGTLTGDVLVNQSSATGIRQIRFQCADNDYGRVAAGGTASNAGWMEIATADDGNEPIYVRQYTGVFSTVARTLTLLDGSGNTSIPGKLNIANPIVSQPGPGTSYIQGSAGDSTGLYVKKRNLNADQWIPGLTIQTKSGGGWAIGNYNNEQLQFSYGTKANIDANNNSTNIWSLNPDGSFNGKAANVTGTVAVANGGTGQTTLANARKAFFPSNHASSGGYLISITDNWADGGYIAKGSVGAWIGGICARPNYSISTTDLTPGTSNLTTNQLYFVYS